MRKQYHLRNSAEGLLAWDVERLISLTEGLPVADVPLSGIRELDEPFWFDPGSGAPTCRRVAEHAALIQEADLAYPIILGPDGRVLDGMHRACKALLAGMETIKALQLPELPEPDFTGTPAEDLPYGP